MTRKIALVGASCSGKTSLLEGLRDTLGSSCTFVEEAARKVIGEQELVRLEPLERQLRIFEAGYEAYFQMEPNVSETTFFDRTPICGLAYVEELKAYKELEELERRCQKLVFHMAFLLEPLPLEDDGLRTLNNKRRLKLAEQHHFFYKKFGIETINVPLASVESRVDFIVKTLTLE
ncbi:MAG: hypothetical protein EP343_11535 [Deltaproteobacteria bacterium]|nr:MAG: hypothetical protein EP343_11535 [Deltaproteobacteria bacterium]